LARTRFHAAKILAGRRISSSRSALNVNGSLKLTHFAAKNDKVKLTHP
jgi:hypothetical protein